MLRIKKVRNFAYKCMVFFGKTHFSDSNFCFTLQQFSLCCLLLPFFAFWFLWHCLSTSEGNSFGVYWNISNLFINLEYIFSVVSFSDFTGNGSHLTIKQDSIRLGQGVNPSTMSVRHQTAAFTRDQTMLHTTKTRMDTTQLYTKPTGRTDLINWIFLYE